MFIVCNSGLSSGTLHTSRRWTTTRRRSHWSCPNPWSAPRARSLLLRVRLNISFPAVGGQTRLSSSKGWSQNEEKLYQKRKGCVFQRRKEWPWGTQISWGRWYRHLQWTLWCLQHLMRWSLNRDGSWRMGLMNLRWISRVLKMKGACWVEYFTRTITDSTMTLAIKTYDCWKSLFWSS